MILDEFLLFYLNYLVLFMRGVKKICYLKSSITSESNIHLSNIQTKYNKYTQSSYKFYKICPTEAQYAAYDSKLNC